MHLPHFALSSVLSLTLCAIPNLGFASSNQTADSTQAPSGRIVVTVKI